jgi:hypothetical protein
MEQRIISSIIKEKFLQQNSSSLSQENVIAQKIHSFIREQPLKEQRELEFRCVIDIIDDKIYVDVHNSILIYNSKKELEGKIDNITQRTSSITKFSDKMILVISNEIITLKNNEMKSLTIPQHFVSKTVQFKNGETITYADNNIIYKDKIKRCSCAIIDIIIYQDILYVSYENGTIMYRDYPLSPRELLEDIVNFKILQDKLFAYSNIVYQINKSEYKTLFSHTKLVRDVIMLPNNNLVSCSDDNTVQIHTLEGKLLHIFNDHRDEVYGLLLLRDRRFISWSNDRSIKIWTLIKKEDKYMWKSRDLRSNYYVYDIIQLSSGEVAIINMDRNKVTILN